MNEYKYRKEEERKERTFIRVLDYFLIKMWRIPLVQISCLLFFFQTQDFNTNCFNRILLASRIFVERFLQLTVVELSRYTWTIVVFQIKTSGFKSLLRFFPRSVKYSIFFQHNFNNFNSRFPKQKVNNDANDASRTPYCSKLSHRTGNFLERSSRLFLKTKELFRWRHERRSNWNSVRSYI